MLNSDNEKLNLKINCINHLQIFNKIIDLSEYITNNLIKDIDIYIFCIEKECHKITIKMRNINNLLNYIFTYHVIYYLD